MSVAKVVEIIAHSERSFDDAVQQGVARASETLQGVTGAWVKDQDVEVKDGRITRYGVTLKVTFVLQSPDATAR